MVRVIERLLAWFSFRSWQDPWYQPPIWMLESVYLARAYYIAAELGIADLLQQQPRTCAELALATGTHERSLHRVLRALASFGVFGEDKRGTFRVTRRTWPLLSSDPRSLRDWILLVGSPAHGQVIAAALDVAKSGSSGYVVAHGRPFYQYCEENPAFAANFRRAMSHWTDLHSRAVAGKCDFGRFGTILDVGGGEGRLIIEILRRNAGTRGVLYDRPQTIDSAKLRLAEANLADRCTFVAGDFLENVPGGADAYVLKHVLRDWNDDDARTILANCHRAMTAASRLIVIDAMLDPRSSHDRLGKLLDLEEMFLMGMLRTRDELQSLFDETGFRVLRVRRTNLPDVAIIEAAQA
jgi:hypothetical protein